MDAALSPDYLSSYLKIGTIAFLIPGSYFGSSEPQHAGPHAIHCRRRPGDSRKLVPVRLHHHRLWRLISGFHALISSGTTPKMIAKETDARMIGYGGMLMEGSSRRCCAHRCNFTVSRGITSPSTQRRKLMHKRQPTYGWSTSTRLQVSTCNRRKSIDLNRSQVKESARAHWWRSDTGSGHRENIQRYSGSQWLDEVLVSLCDHV